MSKLFRQEQALSELRAERQRQAHSAAPILPEPEIPAPVLQVTYQPAPQPLVSTPRPAPAQSRGAWWPARTWQWALAGAAACGLMIAMGGRPAVLTAQVPQISHISVRRLPPTLFAGPAAPAKVVPAAERQTVTAGREQAVDAALADAQRVMGMMDKALRRAAGAYASVLGPTGSTPSDTSL